MGKDLGLRDLFRPHQGTQDLTGKALFFQEPCCNSPNESQLFLEMASDAFFLFPDDLSYRLVENIAGQIGAHNT